MPKLGSQLLAFIYTALVEDKYPNLKWYPPSEMQFSLEHINIRNKTYSKEYAKIYEEGEAAVQDVPKCCKFINPPLDVKNDYYSLKKPGHPMANWVEIKGRLDCALNRKGSKYIQYIKKDGKKYVYEMTISGFSSGSSSPSSFKSEEQDDEIVSLGKKSEIDELISKTLSEIDDEDFLTSQNSSPEMLHENCSDSPTSYMNVSNPQSLGSTNLELTNFDPIDALIPNDEMEMFPVDEFQGPLEHRSLGYVDPQTAACGMETSEKNYSISPETSNPNNWAYFATDLQTNCNLLNLNEDANIPASAYNSFLKNELGVDINQLIQETNMQHYNEGAAAINDLDMQNTTGIATVQGMPQEIEIEVNPDDKFKYCERNLKVEKVGNEYIFIFTSVSNRLPKDDPVFQYLKVSCSGHTLTDLNDIYITPDEGLLLMRPKA